jgi:wyosine [tRNA(Phe)-imidazoG37] synthetase (radical SAM superfamily)
VTDLQGLGMSASGPVPSRRLGKSLGMNNIPAKMCSYSCVYCQLGKTMSMTIERQAFYQPEDIFREAKTEVDEATSRNGKINYLAFVPDGEPTLEIAPRNISPQADWNSNGCFD